MFVTSTWLLTVYPSSTLFWPLASAVPVSKHPAVKLSNCQTLCLSVYCKEMAPRETFGSGKEEGTGEWRKLHNAELHDLYCSLNVIGVWDRWQVFWWGNLKERDHLGDLGVDGRMILKWILNMVGGTYWINLAQVRCTWLPVAKSALQTSRVHKMRRISCVAEQLLASPDTAPWI